MGRLNPDVEENSNPARELPEGDRSVTVMVSELDENPTLAVVLPAMEVEVPPDPVMGVLGKVPSAELGPGAN
jgi:hypothetical protein